VPVEVRTLAEWVAEGVPGMLSVVIPAHNEEGQIETTVRALAQTLAAARITHEIVVVNDNSQDGTGAAIARLTAELPKVRSLDNPPPHGYGYAVRLGLAAFKGDTVVIVMADGSDNPDDVVKFYRKIEEGYDCAFGSRFVRGASVNGYPWVKLVLNRLANAFIRLLFWLPYNDVTNAFKMFRRTVIAGVQPILAYHFNLTVELPLKAIVRGYRYAIVPTDWRGRTAGTSKFKIKEMGSRYLFIVFYCYLEKLLSREDYRNRSDLKDSQLQVWSR